MALIEAALSAARPLLSAAARRAVPLSCAAYSAAGSSGGDIESSPPLPTLRGPRFRERRPLFVTDITATEWCEKQMEFVLKHGKPERTQAMKAGSEPHAQLEQEVIERVDVTIRFQEEYWAVKFIKFIMGANQLLLEGITLELPVIGVIEGSWITGSIDELGMPMDGISLHPILVDIKTCSKPKPPLEGQKRNGRLQVMCYKYLWDNLIGERFPAENFFSYFDLDPGYMLSTKSSDSLDLKRCIELFQGHLPYAITVSGTAVLEADHSLLEEYRFSYDARWFKDQTQEILSFWRGAREPKYVSEKDRWKCNICKFAKNCPMVASTSRCC